ncbi:hypothetical protein TeGR_g9299 [Tetraparma gracilis]|uniref:Uncharacterized protein n=1 Tax=Tetraparma gracilis TaxID=2962635 RepID=A0ABQ6M3R7_9STRA|nr:hypothetical protein TeGR_g9299 [Tetraparma gracilis]
MINGTIPMDDRHYMEFARQELARLRSEGRIPEASPVGKKQTKGGGNFSTNTIIRGNPGRGHGGAGGDEEALDGGAVVSTSTLGPATFSRQERELSNALGGLEKVGSALHVVVDEGLAAGRDGKTEMLQKIGKHAVKMRLKEDLKEGAEEKKERVERSVKEIVCGLGVIGNFVNDKSLENGYVAVQSARHLFKSYEGLVEDVRGGEPGAEGGSEEEVRIALFGVVPALIKRMSAKRTPKELKREVCKTLLCVARGGKINGLDLIVPFLNSPKFALVTRLFVLKLLTKEFGLDRKGCPLTLPMVVPVGLAALAGEAGKLDEKVSRAAIGLVVAASLAEGGGAERVEKYFKIKKTPQNVQALLREKMEDGRVKKVEREERQRLRAEQKAGMAK